MLNSYINCSFWIETSIVVWNNTYSRLGYFMMFWLCTIFSKTKRYMISAKLKLGTPVANKIAYMIKSNQLFLWRISGHSTEHSKTDQFFVLVIVLAIQNIRLFLNFYHFRWIKSINNNITQAIRRVGSLQMKRFLSSCGIKVCWR